MKVPGIIIPLLILFFAGIGIQSSYLFSIPSVDLDFTPASAGSNTVTSIFLVDGVRCVDTAKKAASTLKSIPGMVHFTAFASRNRVEITYDPERVDTADILAAIEGPVFDEETNEIFFNVFSVLEIDGVKIHQ